MVLIADKVGTNRKIINSSLGVPSLLNDNVYKGKFKRPLNKPLSLWVSLFSNGLNACTIDAERQGWNAPRFGVGMFHVKAMMIGSNLYLINSNNTVEENTIERLVLELSVKYNITPDKKVAKSNWNWSGMSPFIKDSSDYLSLMDENNNVDNILNGSYDKHIDLKCKKLCMHFTYAPELLQSKDCPNGIRKTYTKKKGVQGVDNFLSRDSDNTVLSYVLKQYFSNLETEVDEYVHNNITSRGIDDVDLQLFNGGVISPWKALCLLNDVYNFSPNLSRAY